MCKSEPCNLLGKKVIVLKLVVARAVAATLRRRREHRRSETKVIFSPLRQRDGIYRARTLNKHQKHWHLQSIKMLCAFKKSKYWDS